MRFINKLNTIIVFIFFLGTRICAQSINLHTFNNGGGFGDWYLPSKYELNLLFLKRAFVGLFPSFTYWSSNESGNNNAWGQDFSDIWGAQFNTNRTQKHSSVRAIRAF